MREGITVQVSDADRAGLVAIVADRNSPQKHVWRAQIVLLTADGVGTSAIMRRTGKSKVTVWRWQERFMTQGIAGLRRDKTRPSRIPRLRTGVHDRTVALTLTVPPAEVTHWTAAMMAKALGVSVSSVQSHLARARAAAASGAPVQAVLRSAVRRQAARCCRSLCRSAGACVRLVARREVANLGA